MATMSPPIATKCYHCGDVCETKKIVSDNKNFCCQGCKTVHDILMHHDMDSYYSLEAHPGTKPIEFSKTASFDFLDDITIREKIIDFKQGTIEKINLMLPQIHCTSCVWLLENIAQFQSGIISSRVDFLRKNASITYDTAIISLSQIANLLQKIGYAPVFHLEGKDKKQNKNLNHLMYKTGVAGFAFGNVMLFSFPEYLGLHVLQESQFQAFFSYWNLILSLPVVFYSGKDYLISAYRSILSKNLHLDIPIAIGIVSLFGKSVFDIISHTGTGYTDSLTGLIFFMLCGKWFQEFTFHRIAFDRDYKSYFPLAVKKIKNNISEHVLVTQLEIGDQIQIHHQEIIPADSVLMNDKVEIDYSFVSGESQPILKHKGEKIYAGGRLISASAQFEVIKKSDQSYLTQLWNQKEENQTADISQFGALSNQLGKWFTPVLLTIAFIAGIYWFKNESLAKSIQVIVSVLIVACPCALALSAPFTLGNAMSILGRHGFYLKNQNVIEKIGEIDHIVFDKTGTITRNADCKINFEPQQNFEQHHYAAIALLCEQSLHPVSQLIALQFKSYVSENAAKISHLEEKAGEGISATINQLHYKVGNADFVSLPSSLNKGGTFASCNGKIIGKFEIEYVYRTGLDKVIKDLKKQYSLHLISGDHNQERKYLSQLFGNSSQILFEQSPFDKIDFIKSLQQNNEKVMMIGDGLNDAGALKQSDVGIAVSDDINHFSPACDVVLDGKQFQFFNQWLAFCHTSLKLVKTAFIISLLYNSIGIFIAIIGYLQPLYAAILMPASSLSVVFFGIISTKIAATYKLPRLRKNS